MESGETFESRSQAVFDTLRDDMLARNKRGLSFLLAGIAYWLSMTVTGLLLSQTLAAAALLIGTAMIMPLARLFSRWFGIKPASYTNPVEVMTQRLLVAHVMFWPVYLLLFAKMPAYLPQTMSLLMVTPFCVLGYLYRSKVYFHVAVLRWILCSVFMVFPAHGYVAVPLLTAATYGYAAATVVRQMQTATPQQSPDRQVGERVSER